MMETNGKTTLAHFTCDHGATGIRRDGKLRTLSDLGVTSQELADHTWMLRVVWLTDILQPHDRETGLSRRGETISCNRLAHRFRALDTSTAMPWLKWARENGVPRSDLLTLHDDPAALPGRWFVSELPVPVEEWPR